MWIRNIALIAVTMALATPALAQLSVGKNKDQPIEITADALEVLQSQKKATFSGNVRAAQGDVVLTAQQMVVHYRENEERKGDMGAVSRIEAVGGVFLTTPEETAQGAKGVYDVDKKTIWLLENVILTRGENVLKGSQLEYSFDTGKSLVTSKAGDKQGQGRVKAIFVPDKKK